MNDPSLCLSDLALDRLADGELEGRPEAPAARAHLAACRRCQARRAELAAVAPLSPGPEILRSVEPPPVRRRMGRVLGIGGALCAAAAVALFVHFTKQPGEVRLKGGEVSLEILVRSADARSEPALPEVPLHPGDIIGFRVRSARPGYVGVVSVDGDGHVSSYVPGPGGDVVQAAAGEHTLSGAIALDATLGRETVFAVVCAQRADAERAAAAVAPERDRIALPCAQTRVALLKAAPR